MLAGHKEITIEYSERKITETMTKLFGWIVFWSVIHYFRTGEVYDLWNNLVEGASGRGILPVTWFLFTYCFLIILGYMFIRLKKKYSVVFYIVVSIWIVALAMDVGKPIIKNRTQSLWLHLYIGYFILGMSLNSLRENVHKYLNFKLQILAVCCLNLIGLAVYAYQVATAEKFIYPHNYYGEWYYTVWLVSLFWISSMIKVNNKFFQKLVLRLASNTFVVYLGHLPVLLYITSRHPLQKTGEAVLYIIVFFVGFQSLAEVFRRMPLLRKLV